MTKKEAKEIKEVKAVPAKKPKKDLVQTIMPFLFHFPRRYEDRSRWVDPFQVQPGENITVAGSIIKSTLSRWGGRVVLEVIIQVKNYFDTLRLMWFNQPYLKKNLTVGKKMIAYGKISDAKKGRCISHPEFELYDDEEDPNIHLNRITPIYPGWDGLSQRVLRRKIFNILQNKDFKVDDPFPQTEKYIDRDQAITGVHFPTTWDELSQSRRRLVFEELFMMQLLLEQRRMKLTKVKKERVRIHHNLANKFIEQLPYKPTNAQLRSIQEIEGDLKKSYPMNRLLQGDVGSGKTIVAMYSMLLAIEQGKNAALIAPTQILAEQHAYTFRKWLEPLNVKVELWTRLSKPDDVSLFNGIGRIFVGTHAMIQEKSIIPNLGLAVIDEQHKFGVMQRSALQQKGDYPDLLAMTATPIPRTLCLTLYGDLDISIIDEMPPGRGVIKTVLREHGEVERVWDYIKKEIKEGKQAYIVYPLVEDSEKMDLKSVQKAYEEHVDRFGFENVGLLHGKKKPEEKNYIMESFRSKKIKILVTTSVVEVGLDNPDATLMVIEHAERFGLAQMHQLRGRVGRGKHASYCVLVSDKKNEESWHRLQILEKTQNGFELAEEDFKIRGPGNILGTEQSGLPPLKIADLSRDMDILKDAKDSAQKLLEKDPSLLDHPELKERVQAFEEMISLGTSN